MSEVIAGILAAGKGSRLGNNELPKPLVTVGQKPMMENAIAALYKIGFSSDNIYAVIGHLGERIIEHFGNEIRYLHQPTLNGNAGAIDVVYSNVEDPCKYEYLIIQGDDSEQVESSVISDFIHFHLLREADITIMTTSIPDPETHRYEFVFDRDDRIVDFIPRNSVDASAGYMVGIFLFSGTFLQKFLPLLKENTPEGKELGIAELIKLALASEASIFSYHTAKHYISVNTPSGLDRARHFRS